MPDNQPAQEGNVTFNYTVEQARILYYLMEKPPTMSDFEWTIVTNEGFRQFMAGQLKVEYVPHQEMQNRARPASP